MKLFAVENRKTYQKSTSEFKRGVLNVAIDEVNKFTELEVWYIEQKTGNKITGFNLRWSTGKREAGATEKQLSLLREIHDEIDEKVFVYLSTKNTDKLELVRNNIIRIKEINQKINEKLTSKQANEFIQEVKILYEQLQALLENDEVERDTSVYFNWLNEY